jgi:hypothetical protein
MSTKTTTTQQNQYDPTAMNAYQGMTGALNPAVRGYINSPFSNPFFQTQQQMGNNQANMMNQTNMSNIARNWTASGMGSSNSPAMLEMMNNQMRAGTNTRANLGFLAPMQNALNMQQNSMGIAASYRPLQTGDTTTTKKSGLGTWLPQLAGGALSMATGGMFGGGGVPQSAAQVNNVWGSGDMTTLNQPMAGTSQNLPFQMPSDNMDMGGYNFNGPSPFMMNQPPPPPQQGQ